MTTEETELTFVRCPSCRSLVPAVATRCRMCGYSFESGADAEENTDPGASQSKSRVRQRTISASREQLDELANDSSENNARPTEAQQDDEGSESEVRPEATQDQSRAERPSLFAPQEEDESEPLSDPFASDAQAEDAKTEQSSAAHEEQSNSVLEGFSAAILGGEGRSQGREQSGIAVDDPNIYAGSKEEPFVEAAHSDELSEVQQSEHSEETAEETGEQGATEAQQDTKDGPQKDEEKDAADEESQDAPKRKRRRRRRRKTGAQRTGTNEGTQANEVSNAQEKKVMNGTQQQSDASSVSADESIEDGVLVGWFVSFSENSKGEAEELRSGKFFIGRQQLREHDMVIDKDGISTPHCLIGVGSDGVVRVQDLMSENGTYVQRLDSDDFELVSDVAEIEHGDKLRLGSYEVVVCLLPTE